MTKFMIKIFILFIYSFANFSHDEESDKGEVSEIVKVGDFCLLIPYEVLSHIFSFLRNNSFQRILFVNKNLNQCVCVYITHVKFNYKIPFKRFKELPKTFPNIKSIRFSRRQNRNITEKIKDLIKKQKAILHLSVFTKLKVLDLSYFGFRNDVTSPKYSYPSFYLNDEDLLTLSKLLNLQSLNLSECPLITDKGIENLKNLTGLKKLFLKNNKRLITCINHLSGLTNLETLSLKDCDVNDNGLKHLSQCTMIKKLSLARCLITDEGIKYLSNFTKIEYLDLECCFISDTSIILLKKCVNLRKLNIYHCPRITGVGLANLSFFTNLKILSYEVYNDYLQ